MKSINKLQIPAIAFSAVLLAGSASAANLMLNAGFETGNLTSWDLAGGDQVKGTALGITPQEASSQFQFQNAYTQLTQTVTIPTAGDYQLGMWIANRDQTAPNHYMAALGSGTEARFELILGSYTPVVGVYTGSTVTPDAAVTADYDTPRGTYVEWTRTYNSLAAGTYTVFVTNGTGEGAHQGMVDNFTLVAVPEPSTAALLSLGGLALILRRRK